MYAVDPVPHAGLGSTRRQDLSAAASVRQDLIPRKGHLLVLLVQPAHTVPAQAVGRALSVRLAPMRRLQG